MPVHTHGEAVRVSLEAWLCHRHPHFIPMPEVLLEFELWPHFQAAAVSDSKASELPLHLILSNLTSHSSALKFDFVAFWTHYCRFQCLAVEESADLQRGCRFSAVFFIALGPVQLLSAPLPNETAHIQTAHVFLQVQHTYTSILPFLSFSSFHIFRGVTITARPQVQCVFHSWELGGFLSKMLTSLLFFCLMTFCRIAGDEVFFACWRVKRLLCEN